MTSTPYFSVITPSFNQAAYIGKCLESVAAQGDDLEHLIFDNISTDQTAEVVRSFPHATLYSEADRGQSHAVNKGFEAASGEIICWLNSDDVYPSQLFPRLREAFADPAVDVVFGDVEQVTYDGNTPQRVSSRFDRREDLIRWWRRDVSLHQPAIFFRRKVCRKVGLLREELHYAMDYEYWWRLAEHHPFHYLPEVLAIQHRQPESKTILAWSRVYEEREKIFSPFYGLVDDGNRHALMQEKRRILAERFLIEAYSVTDSPSSALRLLQKSFCERPITFFNPRWLGLVRKLVADRKVHHREQEPPSDPHS